MADVEAFELVMPDVPVVDVVVFLHGVGGDACSTWESGEAFWPVWLGQDVVGAAVWSVGLCGLTSAVVRATGDAVPRSSGQRSGGVTQAAARSVSGSTRGSGTQLALVPNKVDEPCSIGSSTTDECGVWSHPRCL